MRLVSAPETLVQYEEAYRACTIRYGDMKKQLAEDMVRFIAPIRERAASILADETYLKRSCWRALKKPGPVPWRP